MLNSQPEVQNWVDSQHRTDDLSKVGKHVFEVAGLGKGPYRFLDCYKKAYVACEGAQPIPAGVCAYCGKGIMYCCVVEPKEGKLFEVGTDCIARTNDKALVRAFKTHPSVRAINRQKAIAKDEKVVAEWNAIMADEAKCAKLSSVKTWDTSWPRREGATQSWLSFATHAWPHCGMAGHARYLKTAKLIIDGKITSLL